MVVSLLLAAVASAAVVTSDSNDWPAVHLYDSFKLTQASVYTWDGKSLTSFKDLVADIKVDGARSKVKVDAKIKVPILGHISAEVLIDTVAGTALEYVPSLHICQHTSLNASFPLLDLLH